MDDNAIIELYWQRSESAVSESQLAYGQYCFAVAHRILSLREDSEECVSDTWLRAWNAIPPERPRILKAFFGRITRNLALDRYEKQHTARRGGGETELALAELEECISDAQTVEQAVTDAELNVNINHFLRSLPERERNIFLCRYYDVMPIKDVAKRFGMKENAVKGSLFRSREKLRAFLEKEEIYL